MVKYLAIDCDHNSHKTQCTVNIVKVVTTAQRTVSIIFILTQVVVYQLFCFDM